MKARVSLSILLAMSATSVVSAESLEERAYWRAQMHEVDELLDWGEGTAA